MIELNVNPSEIKGINEPARLILVAQQKIGKTELCMKLPKSFIIDGEDSMQHYSGSAGFNVIREQKSGKYVKTIPVMETIGTATVQKKDKEGKPMTKKVLMSYVDLVLTEIPAALQHINAQNGGVPYFDFGILDTLTFIEELARELGTTLYKKTVMGASFKGTDVATELKAGEFGGWEWPRKATWKLLQAYDGLFGKAIILTAHLKDVDILTTEGGTKPGRELLATGKMKTILPSRWADATSYMWRSSENQNTITFEVRDNDKMTGARNRHIRGKSFVISELNEEGELVTHWDKIFPSITPDEK